MPHIYHQILFWIYWAITLGFGALLAAILIKEEKPGVRGLAAMLIVPVALRLLLIK